MIYTEYCIKSGSFYSQFLSYEISFKNYFSYQKYHNLYCSCPILFHITYTFLNIFKDKISLKKTRIK